MEKDGARRVAVHCPYSYCASKNNKLPQGIDKSTNATWIGATQLIWKHIQLKTVMQLSLC